MTPQEKSIRSMSDDEIVEALLDSQRVLARTELAIELNLDREGSPDVEEAGWNRAKVLLGLDQFKKEVMRRLHGRNS